MSIIQKAYAKNGFARSCAPAPGCSLFPRGVRSVLPAGWHQVRGGAVAKGGAVHPASLILVPFFGRKGEQTHISVALVRASTDCPSPHGQSKALVCP